MGFARKAYEKAKNRHKASYGKGKPVKVIRSDRPKAERLAVKAALRNAA